MMVLMFAYGSKVQDIQWHFTRGHFHSEPNQYNQNYEEYHTPLVADVLYKTDTTNFPPNIYDGRGCIVGIAIHVDDIFAYHILNEDNQHVITQSCVWS